jgi:hypothetical protein
MPQVAAGKQRMEFDIAIRSNPRCGAKPFFKGTRSLPVNGPPINRPEMSHMDFRSLNLETKERLRPLVKRIVAAMEGAASNRIEISIVNCRTPDNIEPIAKYIQTLKEEGCNFDEIQNISDDDISVFTDDYINFGIDVYFNGRERNNAFFAIFEARLDAAGDFLVFETIQP